MKAKAIAEHIKNNKCAKCSLMKRTNSHTVPGAVKRKTDTKRIDLSHFTEIISIDPVNRVCIAESGVTFSELVCRTLEYGLVPMCVSELKNITIGGAVSGMSIESMSYKYGGFHDTCMEYEVVTGTGDVIVCSRRKDKKIFEMMHGSFGTLGIITRLTFDLVSALPYVHMQYVHYSSFDSYRNAILDHFMKRDVDFMDGIIHSPGDFILCIGTMVGDAPYLNTYEQEVYYKSTLKRTEDYIPIYDYFFRYDADCHWITRNYGLENPLLRTILGRFLLGSRNIIQTANRFDFLLLNPKRPDIVVDVFIPVTAAGNFYDWYLDCFHYFPLWVVPYRYTPHYPWLNPRHMDGMDDNLLFDFAIYGFRQPQDGVNYYRILEKKVAALRGFKALISHNYYDPEEFWRIFNKENYDYVKQRTDPHNTFYDIYSKLHPEE
ncbi:MAG: FAD-binding oxidoreductase [Spirochaetales bacterium]|nr:FAD-binding oxidoreductase [Spirochaetales bacterium]